MALTPMDKKNIQALFKQPIQNVVYANFFMGRKKAQYQALDVLLYMMDDINMRFKGEYTPKIVARILYHTSMFMNKVLDDDLCLDAILAFNDLYLTYQDFIKEHPDKDDAEVSHYFEEIKEMIDKRKPADMDERLKDHETDKKLTEMRKQLDAMGEEIEKLRKQAESDKHKLQDKTQALSKAQTEIDSLNKALAKAKKDFAVLQGKIQEEDDIILSLKAKIEELEKRCQFVNDVYNKNNAEQKGQIESLQKRIRELEEIKAGRNQNDALWKSRYEVDNHIIRFLLKNDCSIEDLKKYLVRLGVDLDEIDLNAHLHRIKRHLRVTTKGVSAFSPIIGINEEVPPKKEWAFKANSGEIIEMIIISNPLYRTNSDDKTKDLLSLIYDYCTKNNIHYIVSLGSFFWAKPRQKYNLAHIDKYRQLIHKAITDYPYDSQIVNFLQGGHSDQFGFKMGISAIDKLCSHRNDFINLGYNASSLIIPGGNNHKINLFATTANTSSDGINDYLNEYYHGSLAKRNESFLDFIGTTGPSGINLTQAFVAIPSLKSTNGCNAYHVKIFVEAGIHRIMLIPLIVNKEVTPTARITCHKNYVKTK